MKVDINLLHFYLFFCGNRSESSVVVWLFYVNPVISKKWEKGEFSFLSFTCSSQLVILFCNAFC